MNFVEITDSINKSSGIYYKDIDETFINEIIKDDRIQTIQISKQLPQEAYRIIDEILKRMPELYFRIYNLRLDNLYDFSFLKEMTHLQKLRIDGDLEHCDYKIDLNILTTLNLKGLELNIFNLTDYSFLQNISAEIKELLIMMDGKSRSVNFDCKWLLRYSHLNTLWLGKNAKRNITCLSEMKSLKALTLRGIKLTNFEFLMKLSLEKLEFLWTSGLDTAVLKELNSLKEIGLWRISKLDNIDFVSNLENLEVIRLKDLRNLKELPDLGRLSNLRELVLDNTGISVEDISEQYKCKVKNYWQ